MTFKNILGSRDVALGGVTFLAAHTGCLATPFISGVTAGFISPQAGLVTGVAFSLATALGADAWLRRVAPIGCARCVASKVDVFKKQAKLLVQAVTIGTMMSFMNHDHHGGSGQNSFRVETLPDGRQMVIKHIIECHGPLWTERDDTTFLPSPVRKAEP